MMRLSKWVGGTLLGIVLLLAGALLLLNTGVIQNHFLKDVVKLVKERLQTEVRVDSISVRSRCGLKTPR